MENIFFDGIGEVCATLPVDDYIFNGCVVALNGDGAAVICEEGAPFVGVAREPRNFYTCVQFKGFVTVGYTGAVSLGWNTLVANDMGGVKPGSTGVKALVVKILDDANAVICL